MLLFINTFITDKRFSKIQYDLRNDDPRYNPSRIEVFRYMLASLAVIPWDHVVIYCELDDPYKEHLCDLINYIDSIFNNPEVYNFRLDCQKKWQRATLQLDSRPNDELIWFCCEDDHVYIDYDLDYLFILVDELKAIQKKHKYVSCYFSHWPEMLTLRNKKGGCWNRKFLYESKYSFTIKWKNSDGISIINKDLMRYWWFSRDYGGQAFRRTDDPEGAVESPEMHTIVPYRELVRHFDGYGHVRMSNNICPPLFIPDGFYESDIRIQFASKKRKPGHVLVNAVIQDFSSVSPSGADLKCFSNELPLFWKTRISHMNVDKHNVFRYKLARNRSLLRTACADFRGSLLPWGVVGKLRYVWFSDMNIFIRYFSAFTAWGFTKSLRRFLSQNTSTRKLIELTRCMIGCQKKPN